MKSDLSVLELLVLSCEKMEDEGYPSSSIKATKTLIKSISANEGLVGWAAKKIKRHRDKKYYHKIGEGIANGFVKAIHDTISESAGKESKSLKREVEEEEKEKGKNWISRHPVASTALGAGAGAAVVGGAVYMGHHGHANEGFGFDPDLFD